jgi:hypothetical protein
MGRLVVIMFMLLLAAILQMAIPGVWMLAGAKAPVLVAIVVYYATAGSLTTACSVSVAAALMHDALSPVPMGYSVIVFGLIALIAAELRRVVDMDQWVSRWIMGFASASIVTLIQGVVLVRYDWVECSAVRVTAKALGTGVLGVAVISLVYVVAGSLHQLTDRRV